MNRQVETRRAAEQNSLKKNNVVKQWRENLETERGLLQKLIADQLAENFPTIN
jgi:hypothetical protein